MSAQDAEDLLLEVFTAAIENSGLLVLSEQEQAAWLQRVAHNKMVDLYRRQSYRQTLDLEHSTPMLFADDYSVPEYHVERQECYAELWYHISQLPVSQQEALKLRFLQGLSSKEIAQRLQKSDMAIRRLLSRAINVLRTIYEKNERGL
jgi:RNA polymerase sigma-70 factor (ECF subfamily)